MDFVDDVDLVFALCRGEGGLFAKLADVVDTGVRGGVDLDDVGVIIFGGIGEAVNLVGENAGHRGLAAATGADKEVGVGSFARF